MMKQRNRFEELVPPAAKKQFHTRWAQLESGKKPIAYLAGHIMGFARPSEDNFQRAMNQAFAKLLSGEFAVFLPQVDNPYGTLKKNSQGFEMALVDFEAIRLCNLLVAVGGFGKDTSVECGHNRCRKPAFLVLPAKKEVEYHNEDWMLMDCFDAVFVPKGEAGTLDKNGICAPGMKILEFEKLDEIAKRIAEIYCALTCKLQGIRVHA